MRKVGLGVYAGCEVVKGLQGRFKCGVGSGWDAKK